MRENFNRIKPKINKIDYHSELITNKQQWAITVIQNNGFERFTGKTKYDAYAYINKHRFEYARIKKRIQSERRSYRNNYNPGYADDMWEDWLNYECERFDPVF